jgi:hypothetical protein
MGTKRATMAFRNDGSNHLTYRNVDGNIAAFSYETCIMQTAPNGQTIGNVTHYSTTTSRHQNKVGAHNADILLDNVPKGTESLVDLYLGRGGQLALC